MSLFVGKNTVNLGVKIEETDRSVQHSFDYCFSISIFFNALTKLVLFIVPLVVVFNTQVPHKLKGWDEMMK